MRRGNLGVLAGALFGLTLFAAMAGYVLAASGYPKPERYPAYSETGQDRGNANVAALAENASAPQDKQPCRNPESREESDLCAQWVAANAARQNVLWTERDFWIGLVTALGLGFTIILTLRAVLASERSLEHAKWAATNDLRPWLDIKIQPQWMSAHPSEVFICFGVEVANSGRTPAQNLRLETSNIYAPRIYSREDVRTYFDYPFAENPDPEDRGPVLPGTNFSDQEVVKIPWGEDLPINPNEGVVPIIGVTVLYDLPSGEVGQTSRSFFVGWQGGEGGDLGPFRIGDDHERRDIGVYPAHYNKIT